MKCLMALGSPARESTSRALHNRDAIAHRAAIISGAPQMRLDDGGALRLS
jgi:hypothetical protein